MEGQLDWDHPEKDESMSRMLSAMCCWWFWTGGETKEKRRREEGKKKIFESFHVHKQKLIDRVERAAVQVSLLILVRHVRLEHVDNELRLVRRPFDRLNTRWLNLMLRVLTVQE